MRKIFLLVKDLAVTLIIVYIILTFIAQNAIVSGASMMPTLDNGDLLLVDKLSYRLGNPKSGQIVVFKLEDEKKLLVKRIIGVPGDEVDIQDGFVYVNKDKLVEPYIQVVTMPGVSTYPITLEENEYFVLGDNRNNSRDSRHPTVGAVDRSQIVGRARFRFWPISGIGLLK